MADQTTKATYTIEYEGREAIGEITITIRDVLKANPDSLSVHTGSVTVFDPKENDQGPEGFRITAVSQPSIGTIAITLDNKLEYTAPA